jgi:signal transduction histidine kinase
MKNIFLAALLYVLTSLCSATLLTAQKNRAIVDSLEKLTLTQKDSALVQTLNELTWQYRMIDKDKAIDYGNKAIEAGKKINFYKGIAQGYNDMGIIYFDKENYDTAIMLYNKAIQIRQQLKDEKGIAKLYNKIGIVYQKQGLFDKALENQFKALSIFEKAADKIGISYSLNNIGIINQNMGLYEKAIEFQEKSILIKEEIGDKYGLSGSYVNIGNNYLNLKQYKKAESYYNKAIDITRIIGDKEYLSNALNNIGNLYIQTGELSQAIPPILESYKLRDSLHDTKGMVSCLNNLADIYIQQKLYDSAEKKLNLGLSMGLKAVNCKPELNKIYFTLAKLFEAKGENDRALAMYKLYSTSKDSLYTDELSQKFAELDTRYKTLEKEKTIQQQQFDITRKNYLILTITGILLTGLLLGYSWYRRYKMRQQRKIQTEIIKQQDISTRAILQAEENERKRIAADLHDGVGQLMSAAKMNLSAFEHDLPFKSDEQKSAYEKAIALVDESCREVRSISHQMMPNALLKSGLSSAIKEFIDKIDSSIIKINLHTEGLNERLDSNIETVCYRVIQECVNNVIKHSGANMLEISLIKDEDGISATIEDNGKGFNSKEVEKVEGIGLKNIRSRIQYLKGTVDFDSEPGKGTLVAIHVPVG